MVIFAFGDSFGELIAFISTMLNHVFKFPLLALFIYSLDPSPFLLELRFSLALFLLATLSLCFSLPHPVPGPRLVGRALASEFSVVFVQDHREED